MSARPPLPPRRRRAGFSLLEVMGVLLIGTISAVFAATLIARQTEEHRALRTAAAMREIMDAAQKYAADEFDRLAVLPPAARADVQDVCVADLVEGGFLAGVPRQPHGLSYHVAIKRLPSPPTLRELTAVSVGEPGAPPTTDSAVRLAAGDLETGETATLAAGGVGFMRTFYITHLVATYTFGPDGVDDGGPAPGNDDVAGPGGTGFASMAIETRFHHREFREFSTDGFRYVDRLEVVEVLRVEDIGTGTVEDASMAVVANPVSPALYTGINPPPGFTDPNIAVGFRLSDDGSEYFRVVDLAVAASPTLSDGTVLSTPRRHIHRDLRRFSILEDDLSALPPIAPIVTFEIRSLPHYALTGISGRLDSGLSSTDVRYFDTRVRTTTSFTYRAAPPSLGIELPSYYLETTITEDFSGTGIFSANIFQTFGGTPYQLQPAPGETLVAYPDPDSPLRDITARRRVVSRTPTTAHFDHDWEGFLVLDPSSRMPDPSDRMRHHLLELDTPAEIAQHAALTREIESDPAAVGLTSFEGAYGVDNTRVVYRLEPVTNQGPPPAHTNPGPDVDIMTMLPPEDTLGNFRSTGAPAYVPANRIPVRYGRALQADRPAGWADRTTRRFPAVFLMRRHPHGSPPAAGRPIWDMGTHPDYVIEITTNGHAGSDPTPVTWPAVGGVDSATAIGELEAAINQAHGDPTPAVAIPFSDPDTDADYHALSADYTDLSSPGTSVASWTLEHQAPLGSAAPDETADHLVQTVTRRNIIVPEDSDLYVEETETRYSLRPADINRYEVLTIDLPEVPDIAQAASDYEYHGDFDLTDNDLFAHSRGDNNVVFLGQPMEVDPTDGSASPASLTAAQRFCPATEARCVRPTTDPLFPTRAASDAEITAHYSLDLAHQPTAAIARTHYQRLRPGPVDPRFMDGGRFRPLLPPASPYIPTVGQYLNEVVFENDALEGAGQRRADYTYDFETDGTPRATPIMDAATLAGLRFPRPVSTTTRSRALTVRLPDPPEPPVALAVAAYTQGPARAALPERSLASIAARLGDRGGWGFGDGAVETVRSASGFASPLDTAAGDGGQLWRYSDDDAASYPFPASTVCRADGTRGATGRTPSLDGQPVAVDFYFRYPPSEAFEAQISSSGARAQDRIDGSDQLAHVLEEDMGGIFEQWGSATSGLLWRGGEEREIGRFGYGRHQLDAADNAAQGNDQQPHFDPTTGVPMFDQTGVNPERYPQGLFEHLRGFSAEDVFLSVDELDVGALDAVRVVVLESLTVGGEVRAPAVRVNAENLYVRQLSLRGGVGFGVEGENASSPRPPASLSDPRADSRDEVDHLYPRLYSETWQGFGRFTGDADGRLSDDAGRTRLGAACGTSVSACPENQIGSRRRHLRDRASGGSTAPLRGFSAPPPPPGDPRLPGTVPHPLTRN